MNQLQELMEQSRFSEIADLLEGVDSPLDSQVRLRDVSSMRCFCSRYSQEASPDAE